MFGSLLILLLFIMSSMWKVIRHSLQGTKKPHLHKYCKRATNHGYKSPVYAAQ